MPRDMTQPLRLLSQAADSSLCKRPTNGDQSQSRPYNLIHFLLQAICRASFVRALNCAACANVCINLARDHVATFRNAQYRKKIQMSEHPHTHRCGQRGAADGGDEANNFCVRGMSPHVAVVKPPRSDRRGCADCLGVEAAYRRNRVARSIRFRTKTP